MSATMARQGGRVKLEQSDMCLALNMAKVAKGGFWRMAMYETRFLNKKPCGKVRDEKKLGVEFPGHRKVKDALEWHPAMRHQHHTPGCLPRQNGIAKNPQTQWRRKRTGTPPPDRRRQPPPEQTPSLPETPPAPTGHNSGAQHSQIINLPAGCVYSHTSLPWAEFVTLDASAQGSQQDTDVDPDMLTDEGTSTG